MTPRSHHTYTVLVIDDDPSVRATYRRLLCRSGYDTRVADGPAEVLASEDGAREAHLLLLDYKMPGIDGLTLLAELRRRGCRARCILVSAFLNEEIRQRAGLLGVDRVLEKPVDVSRLREVLTELLPVAGGRVAAI